MNEVKKYVQERIKRAAIAMEAAREEKRKRDRELYKFLIGQQW